MSTLSWILRRTTTVTFAAREDAAEALRSLISLKGYVTGGEHNQQVYEAFKSVAKLDRSLVADALQKMRVDPHEVAHGSRVALLAITLPELGAPDERVWENVMKSAEVGLSIGKWAPRDCRHIVQAAAYWGIYPRQTLPGSIERYIAKCVTHVSQSDLAHLSAMLTALTETYRSPLIQNVAQRSIVLADTLSAHTIGQLARQWVRAQYKHTEAVGALANQLVRVVESLELIHSVPLLALLANHKEHCKKEPISVLLIQIAEHFEGADLDTTILLLKALSTFEEPLKAEVAFEWSTLVDGVSERVLAFLKLPAPEGAEMSIETSTVLLTRYFHLVERRSGQETLSSAVTDGLKGFAKYVTEKAEDFVSDQNPPFTIITPLLHAGIDETTEAAMALLRETAVQDVPLPTLNVFRYILLLCDMNIFDAEVNNYLRTSFISSCENIPIVQLCTALKCFAITEAKLFFPEKSSPNPAAEGEEKKEEEEDEEEDDGKLDRDIFVDQLESLVKLHSGKDMRALLSIVRSVSEMRGESDTFFDMAACAMVNLMDSCNPSVQSAASAAVCMKALEKPLRSRTDLKALLEKITEVGLKNEATKPSKWMQENDTSAILEPLSPEQQKMREIVTEMQRCRAADTTRLGGLAAEYAGMLPKHARIEDVCEFFHVFADKVYKNDKVLNDCLKHLMEKKAVEKMTPFSLSSILQSLASIRFAYHVTAKKFIGLVTEEQWAEFDGGSLSVTVLALSKLSIRMPVPLSLIGERLINIAPQLSPLDLAHVIGGLQNLGFHDETVMKALIHRAQDIAAEFSSSQICYLMSSPQIGRLLTDASIASPLIQRVLYFSSHYSPNEKQRIANNLRRTTLPRELLSSTTAALEIGPSSAAPGRALTA